jgi:hypothetical protein
MIRNIGNGQYGGGTSGPHDSERDYAIASFSAGGQGVKSLTVHTYHAEIGIFSYAGISNMLKDLLRVSS